MFDTMTLTKVSGAIIGALLIFLLGNWTAQGLYSTGGGHGGDDHAATGYVIATAEDAPAEEEAVEEVSFAELLAAADADKGKKAWSKCKACHKLEDGKNSTGPHLYGLIDRPIAGVDGFGYSDALAGLGGNWTVEELDAWLENPKAYAPGNKMTFKGMKKPTDRANLVAYLQTIGG